MTVSHWIDGAQVAPAGPTQPILDPATGRQVGEVALADAGVVDVAVRRAAEAQRAWGAVSLAKRMEVMYAFRQLLVENTDALARIISREHGKTVPDAAGEIARGRESVEFACNIAAHLKGEYSSNVSSGVDVHSIRQPVGVVAGITPFNFPAMVPMWMHPIAIATGNAFVLKPSERDPSASNIVAELYKRAGLPDGVFQVVHGGKDAVDALLTHPLVAAVSFVGSTPIAQYVQRTAISAGKRVQALGGANNHAVVMPDADMAFAASQIAAGAFGSAGERCMAVPVAVAVGGAGDALVAALAKEANAIVVGPGDESATTMGPVITAASRQRVLDFVEEAVAGGAEAVVDGRDLVVAGHEEGFFVGPTVLRGVAPTMRAYCDEVFGPLLVVMEVDTLEDAVALINSGPYGNGTAIFTASGEAARLFTETVQVGMIGVNVPIPVPVGYYSFGGWKSSLFGDHHAHGPEAVRFYTRAKAITTRWPHQQQRSVSASFDFPGHS
ncbi:MAG: CoA-acylating methylmalonate-semialdehyde dehydrogenase [Propionibacteriaceae bacterium]